MEPVIVTPLIASENGLPAGYATLQEFADNYLPKKISTRTAKRWLTAGEVPGAEKTPDGRWMIPASARHTPNVEPTTDVALTPGFQAPAVTPVQYDAPPAPLPEIPAGRTFFSAAEASALMSCPEMHISEYSIRKNREYYHATIGENGAVAVPRYRILQLKGLLPQ